ncbi:MAG: HAMP domain-containing protein [Spirochaetales bacterium]|nr:HAMP domain-containing protein [Spirochaetales bacterium]
MKLKARFSLIIGSLLFIAAALTAFVIFSFAHVSRLQTYQTRTSDTVTEWVKLRIFLSDIFTVSFDVDTVDSRWMEINTNFSGSFSGIAESPLRGRLSAETNQLIDNAGNLLELMQKSFTALDSEIGQLSAAGIASNTKLQLKSRGLSSVFNSRESEDSSAVTLCYLQLSSSLYKMNVYSAPFESILEEIKNHLDRDVSANIRSVLLRSILVLAVLSLAAFLVIFRMTSKIVRRLDSLRDSTESLAAKDLTISVGDRYKDEIGELSGHLDTSIKALNGVMKSVQTAADDATGMSESINFAAGEVTTATTEISSNIESMDKQFDNIKTAMKNASSALESMSSFLVTFMTDIERQNSSIADSGKAISVMSESINTVSRKGRDKTRQMDELQRVAQEGEEKIENTDSILVGVTGQLDEVHSFITMINSIAEQTSILSMNAAIESAHAGEAGKGFAVVADEIQKLAESTTENAQLITTTLTEIISNVQEARNSSQSATEAFSNTTSAIQELNVTLNEIVSALELIDERSGELSRQSKEVLDTTSGLSVKTDKLDSLRKTAIHEIIQMDSIIAESSGGVSEIAAGTGDILKRIMEIHELSTKSKEAMKVLDSMLEEFRTTDSTIQELD